VTVASQSIAGAALIVDAYQSVAGRPGADLGHEPPLVAGMELGHD
jgi:hypothetical protein